ncbi:MAG: hypothetical protein IPK60_14905 [Sandaracinaceae bacterium]|nr:hypothetical protein [Sandaracinaceae bacterium]
MAKLSWFTCAAVLCLLLASACSSSHPTCTGPDCGDAGMPPPDAGTGCLPRAAETHRPAAIECSHDRPPGSMPTGTIATCMSDVECTDGINGRCSGNGHDGWRCTYDECFADTDCPAMNICSCDGASRSGANICVVGNCQTDSDCGTGFCSPTLGSCGHYLGPVGWYCHTCADTCINDSDCSGDAGGGYCAFDPIVGHWGCQTAECVG